MMRYILKSCQEIKVYAVERISNGDRRPGGPAGGAKRGIEEWLNDFMRKHTAIGEVPRYALRDALTRVWEEGIHGRMPYQKKEWNIFRVDPRPGWKTAEKKVEEASLSWEDYQAGKSAVTTVRPLILTKSKTATKLFERGLLDFKWGHVEFKRKAQEELNALLVEKSWMREELVANIQVLEFCSVGTQGLWQVNLVFK